MASQLISPDEAFVAFLALGPRRTLTGLAERLQADYPPETLPMLNTLQAWSRNHDWTRRSADHDRQVREVAERQVLEEQASAAASQALIIETTGFKAFQKLASLIDKIDEQKDRPLQDLQLLAEIGEKLIQTSRSVGMALGATALDDADPASLTMTERLTRIVLHGKAKALNGNGHANGNGPVLEHEPSTAH